MNVKTRRDGLKFVTDHDSTVEISKQSHLSCGIHKTLMKSGLIAFKQDTVCGYHVVFAACLLACLLIVPAPCKEYPIRHRSAQTCCHTDNRQLQTILAVSTCHSILTPGQLVPALSL